MQHTKESRREGPGLQGNVAGIEIGSLWTERSCCNSEAKQDAENR